MHVTPLFINLHWLPIAARIKFKALMFAYKTTSGSAPLYLNSVLQSYVPLEACVLQVNHPKVAQNHFFANGQLHVKNFEVEKLKLFLSCKKIIIIIIIVNNNYLQC